MPRTAISFVIPVRNDAARLERCLASIIRDAGATPIEVIVADNGSTDNSAAVATKAGATVVSLPNRPVSDVRNRAAAVATSDLIAFVDADHELGAGWIQTALRTFGDPKIAAAGADYLGPPGGTWVQRIYDAFRSHAEGPHQVTWLPSGNLVVRRSAFLAVQGFDTSLESCEDVDFCRRIRETGGLLVETAAFRSTHAGDPRSLKALFLSELWRGRDNLRVSLRERLTLRTAPSIVLPILQLLAIATMLAGAVVLAVTGRPWIAGGALAISVLLISARAARLWRRLPPGHRGPVSVLQTGAVAATYDLARALALVTRVGHDVRRKG